jgi:hypothetical protein
MNLHIKVKHNGGTKKEREDHAVMHLLFREPSLRLKNAEKHRHPRPSTSPPTFSR